MVLAKLGEWYIIISPSPVLLIHSCYRSSQKLLEWLIMFCLFFCSISKTRLWFPYGRDEGLKRIHERDGVVCPALWEVVYKTSPSPSSFFFSTLKICPLYHSSNHRLKDPCFSVSWVSEYKKRTYKSDMRRTGLKNQRHAFPCPLCDTSKILLFRFSSFWKSKASQLMSWRSWRAQKTNKLTRCVWNWWRRCYKLGRARSAYIISSGALLVYSKVTTSCKMLWNHTSRVYMLCAVLYL